MPTRGTTPSRNDSDRYRGFQSTCPRGARLPVLLCLSRFHHFNPRAHEGHDFLHAPNKAMLIFQSTCPRGARHLLSLHTAYFRKFQSTCPRGARLPATDNHQEPRKFQSTCPRGARRFYPDFLISCSSFQSTCPRGARHFLAKCDG